MLKLFRYQPNVGRVFNNFKFSTDRIKFVTLSVTKQMAYEHLSVIVSLNVSNLGR